MIKFNNESILYHIYVPSLQAITPNDLIKNFRCQESINQNMKSFCIFDHDTVSTYFGKNEETCMHNRVERKMDFFANQLLPGMGL